MFQHLFFGRLWRHTSEERLFHILVMRKSLGLVKSTIRADTNNYCNNFLLLLLFTSIYAGMGWPSTLSLFQQCPASRSFSYTLTHTGAAPVQTQSSPAGTLRAPLELLGLMGLAQGHTDWICRGGRCCLFTFLSQILDWGFKPTAFWSPVQGLVSLIFTLAHNRVQEQ